MSYKVKNLLIKILNFGLSTFEKTNIPSHGIKLSHNEDNSKFIKQSMVKSGRCFSCHILVANLKETYYFFPSFYLNIKEGK